ncbi:hypothetical protein KI387_018823, partial [Taxus chinensis]
MPSIEHHKLTSNTGPLASGVHPELMVKSELSGASAKVKTCLYCKDVAQIVRIVTHGKSPTLLRSGREIGLSPSEFKAIRCSE